MTNDIQQRFIHGVETSIAAGGRNLKNYFTLLQSCYHEVYSMVSSTKAGPFMHHMYITAKSVSESLGIPVA